MSPEVVESGPDYDVGGVTRGTEVGVRRYSTFFQVPIPFSTHVSQ